MIFTSTKNTKNLEWTEYVDDEALLVDALNDTSINKIEDEDDFELEEDDDLDDVQIDIDKEDVQLPQQSRHQFTVDKINEIHNEVDRMENNLHTLDHSVVGEMKAAYMEFFNPDEIKSEIDEAIDTLCTIELIDAKIWISWGATNSQRKKIRSKDREQVKSLIISGNIKKIRENVMERRNVLFLLKNNRLNT